MTVRVEGDNPAPKDGFVDVQWKDNIYVVVGSPQQGVDATAKASVLAPVA